MRFKDLIYLIRSDLYRYERKTDLKTFLIKLCISRGFKIGFLYRICVYLRNRPKFLRVIPEVIFRFYKLLYSADFATANEIGSGLYIGHTFCNVIGHNIKIGKNVNINHGCTIGRIQRGPRKGFPTIGDNVFIGPGACVLDNIKVGNNVAIGANSVVTSDIPDNVVVAGIPAKTVSHNGSEGLVNNTDYDRVLPKCDVKSSFNHL